MAQASSWPRAWPRVPLVGNCRPLPRPGRWHSPLPSPPRPPAARLPARRSGLLQRWALSQPHPPPRATRAAPATRAHLPRTRVGGVGASKRSCQRTGARAFGHTALSTQTHIRARTHTGAHRVGGVRVAREVGARKLERVGEEHALVAGGERRRPADRVVLAGPGAAARSRPGGRPWQPGAQFHGQRREQHSRRRGGRAELHLRPKLLVPHELSTTNFPVPARRSSRAGKMAMLRAVLAAVLVAAVQSRAAAPMRSRRARAGGPAGGGPLRAAKAALARSAAGPAARLAGGRRVRGARKTSRQEGRQAGGRGWGGVACGASQQDPSRTTAVRPGHPVARLGGRRGRDRAARRSGGVGWCGPGGRRCVPPSSPALRLPSFVTPASLRWPCWPRVATGCGSTVCPGGCVHRAGQRLQRHDLVRPAGLSAT